MDEMEVRILWDVASHFDTPNPGPEEILREREHFCRAVGQNPMEVANFWEGIEKLKSVVIA